MSGLVLVWDMDNTLIGNYFSVNEPGQNQKLVWNEKAIAVLRSAIEARAWGRVSAIFLLTNNSDELFVDFVKRALADRLYQNPNALVFDGTMIRQDPRRPLSNDPPKRLYDVESLMIGLGKSIKKLPERTFFFDDRNDHLIREEIPADHYIQITPPFQPGVRDTTKYQAIYNALGTKGGKRKRKTRKERKSGKRFLTTVLRKTELPYF